MKIGSLISSNVSSVNDRLLFLSTIIPSEIVFNASKTFTVSSSCNWTAKLSNAFDTWDAMDAAVEFFSTLIF